MGTRTAPLRLMCTTAAADPARANAAFGVTGGGATAEDADHDEDDDSGAAGWLCCCRSRRQAPSPAPAAAATASGERGRVDIPVPGVSLLQPVEPTSSINNDTAREDSHRAPATPRHGAKPHNAVSETISAAMAAQARGSGFGLPVARMLTERLGGEARRAGR
jgi:hypothetical protein